MLSLYRSGAVLDAAIAITSLELVLLFVLSALGRLSLRPRDVAGQVVAGLCLLGAIRAHLAGASDWVPLTLLSASLPAHAYDLSRRLRRSDASARG